MTEGMDTDGMDSDGMGSAGMDSAGMDTAQFNTQLIGAFRASGGHGESGPVHFDRLVLLTTTGRRSGNRHTVPLGTVRDDAGNIIVFGSNMGAPREPDWVRNIRADPHVTVEITDEMFDADAVILTGAARGEAYQRWVDAAPHTAGHQDKAGREIPMVLIQRP